MILYWRPEKVLISSLHCVFYSPTTKNLWLVTVFPPQFLRLRFIISCYNTSPLPYYFIYLQLIAVYLIYILKKKKKKRSIIALDF